METRQTLKKVGESVVVTIPPAMLQEIGVEVGQDVLLTSGRDSIRLEPSVDQPSSDAVEFAARFTKQYEQAMKNLAGR